MKKIATFILTSLLVLSLVPTTIAGGKQSVEVVPSAPVSGDEIYYVTNTSRGVWVVTDCTLNGSQVFYLVSTIQRTNPSITTYGETYPFILTAPTGSTCVGTVWNRDSSIDTKPSNIKVTYIVS